MINKNTVLYPLRLFKSLIVLTIGFIHYTASKTNTERSYQAMIRSFCLTLGLSNDFLSWMISLKSSKLEMKNELSKTITKSLARDGYYVLENFLSSDQIESLQKLTEKYSCLSRDKSDLKIIPLLDVSTASRDVLNTRLDYFEKDLILDPVVQKIVTTPLFLEVASNYLKAMPKIDIVTMWWTFANRKTNLAEDAQVYHFDMDRIKWLKIFIYLDDVNIENGPHSFIRGSHRSFKIPYRLLSRGYARLSDEDVFNSFSKGSEITFCGKKGTIIFEDTRGLHKGNPIKEGHRLVFQVEYVNSLFGAPTDKTIKNFEGPELFQAYLG